MGELLNNQELFQLVNKISVTFFDKPFRHEVKYNHRLRTTGGRYIPSKTVIELNPKYQIEMGSNEFIGIIKHELCHYHLHIEGKGYKHGDRDFKELLRKTGSPRFCNPLPSERDKSTYLYICKDCNMHYRRRRRINLHKYRCGRCSGRLILK